MNHVSRVTRTAGAALATSNGVPVTPRLGEVDPATGEVVEKLFRQLQAIFPAWKQAWPDEKALSVARRSWTVGLMAAGINTVEQVKYGVEQCRRSGSPFAPSIGQFVEWCRPTPEMLGLPTEDQAFREACRNAHPAMAGAGKWSHAAVYHAAAEAGFHNLNTLRTADSRKLFVRNYVMACRMVVEGKPLKAMPLALPEKVDGRMTPAVGNSALAALRNVIKGAV